MDISTVLVSYNSANVIGKAIDSLLSQKGVKHEIIVVDNNSQDESLKILESYQDKIKLVLNDKNDGFGKAANLGLSYAQGNYFYSFNPDAYFETTDSFAKMLAYMKKNPQYGMLATRIYSGKNKLEPSVLFEYPGEKKLKHKFNNLPGKIAWIFGASMLIPAEIFKQIQGFDEDYFVNFEDTDISLRVRKAGYPIGLIDDVHVMHIGQVSRKQSKEFDKFKHPIEGLYKFYCKNYHPEDVILTLRNHCRRSVKRMRIYKMLHLLLGSKDAKYRYDKHLLKYNYYNNYLQDQLSKFHEST